MQKGEDIRTKVESGHGRLVRAMKWNRYVLVLVVIGCCAHLASARQVAGPEERPQTRPDAGKKLSPQMLVREGNRRYASGDYDSALDAYNRAKVDKPDALELDYNQGLGHFAKGEYDQARDAFGRALLSTNRALADDAIYGLATADHAEALIAEDPQVSITGLESAMRRYQDVLLNNRDHQAAREGNLKAATMWRQLKEQLQQQQQQQQNQGEQDQEQENQQQDQSNPQQEDEQKQQPEQGQPPEQNQEAEPTEQDQQPDRADREQAERELRRMIDEMKERQRDRSEPVHAVRPVRVEKDW